MVEVSEIEWLPSTGVNSLECSEETGHYFIGKRSESPTASQGSCSVSVPAMQAGVAANLAEPPKAVERKPLSDRKHLQATQSRLNSSPNKPEESKAVQQSTLASQRRDCTSYQRRLAAIKEGLASIPKAPSGSKRQRSPATESKKPKNLAAVFLSTEQRSVLQMAQQGISLFYTGSAGTGKSVLLREIIATLRLQHPAPGAVAVTASTGLSAFNIGGVTLHSFSGVGIADRAAEEVAKDIRKRPTAREKWLKAKVLVIDEISMVHAKLFNLVSSVGQIIRMKAAPFGGLQVIVTGDFMQLPPVGNEREENGVKFAFEAEVWKAAITRTICLRTVFRQKDPAFVKMLDEVRCGEISNESEAAFRQLDRALTPPLGIEPAILLPLRSQVRDANEQRLKQLQCEELTFRALDGGALYNTKEGQKMLDNFLAQGELRLRVGAQVMLIKNLDACLVNGSMGRLVRFETAAGYLNIQGDPAEKRFKGVRSPDVFPIVAFVGKGGEIREEIIQQQVWEVKSVGKNGKDELLISRLQIPLILSWAISMHKAQGLTLDWLRVDLEHVFTSGQAYVALSRATSLEGLQVLNFKGKKVKVNKRASAFMKSLETVGGGGVKQLKEEAPEMSWASTP